MKRTAFFCAAVSAAALILLPRGASAAFPAFAEGADGTGCDGEGTFNEASSGEDDLWRMLEYGESGEEECAGDGDHFSENGTGAFSENGSGDFSGGGMGEDRLFAPVVLEAVPDETGGAKQRDGTGEQGADAAQPLRKLRAAVWMEGAMDPDGRFYYRGDNCGVLVQLEGCVDAGRIAVCFDGEDRTPEGTHWTDPDGKQVFGFAAEQVSSFFAGDGEHRIGIYQVENGASRELLPVTAHPSDDELMPFCSEGVEIREGEAYFVMDRVPPVCAVTIRSPGAARKKLSKRGSRYYFNSAFEAHFAFSDDNLDPARIEVRRGSIRDGQYDSEKSEILAFPDVLTLSGGEKTDSREKDGLYRYLISGCDKAGNPVKSAGGDLGPDGRTRHIAVTRSLPEGKMTVLSDGREVLSAEAGGKSGNSAVILAGKRAGILLETDVFRTHMPVKIRCVLRTAGASRKKVFRTRKAACGASLLAELEGRQLFRIEKYVMTDLAGNKRTVKISRDFLLDPEPPSLVLRTDEPAGYDGGRPLYSKDVRIGIDVDEGGEGRGGTGLKEVACVLTAGGRSERRILFQGDSSRSAFHWSGETVVSASGYEADRIRAEVTAADFAGNTSSYVYEFAIDGTPPLVRLSFGKGGAKNSIYFPDRREARLEVRDHHFDPGQVYVECAQPAAAGDVSADEAQPAAAGDVSADEAQPAAAGDVTADGAQPFLTGEWRREGEGESGSVWVRDLVFERDGRYRVSVRAADLLGNRAEGELAGEAARDFVIDRTPPAIAVNGEEGREKKKYYAGQRALSFRVEDENFADEGGLLILRDGEADPVVPCKAGALQAVLSEDGVYEVSGFAEDLAGNRAEELLTETFVIDRTPPLLEVIGIKDGSANRENAVIRLRIADRNLSKKCLRASLSKDGGKAENLSGELQKEEDGYLMELPPISEDGLYILLAKGKDRAGNEVSREVSFSVNKQGTVFGSGQGNAGETWFRGPVRPHYSLYDVDEVTILSCCVNGAEVPYTFRDEKLTLRDELKEDGEYTVSIRTKDAAGHENVMEPETIRIDTTPPLLAVSGLTGGKKYYFDPVDLLITSDDPEAAFEKLTLDGKKVSCSGESLFGSGMELHAATYGEHEVRILLADPAGNRSKEWVRTFVITDDPLLRLTANPVVPLILIAAAAGVIFLLILRKKRKNPGSENLLDSDADGDI